MVISHLLTTIWHSAVQSDGNLFLEPTVSSAILTSITISPLLVPFHLQGATPINILSSVFIPMLSILRVFLLEPLFLIGSFVTLEVTPSNHLYYTEGRIQTDVACATTS
jgi:hypothetical protein